MRLSILPLITLAAVSSGLAGQAPAYRPAIGLRTGYANLGGDQFGTLSNGLTFEGFVRTILSEHVSVEVGASAAAHQESLLCVSFRPCRESQPSVITGVFAAPSLRRGLPGTSVVAYGGMHAGLLFATFQDRGPGVELGLLLGGAFPLVGNLSGDVSAMGSMVHVGTTFPRSAFGRRLVLRFGGAYAWR